MRRRVALCNFNPVDYSRQEDQEGVGLKKGNVTGLWADNNPIAPWDWRKGKR